MTLPNPVNQALWFIESHFAEAIDLDAVAEAAGVSKHHLVRAFGYALGRSVMAYVRARRLSESAKALAAGAPNILSIALDASYASHEAFTRAFVDLFAMTPEAVRAQGHTRNLTLQEPIKMTESLLDTPLKSRRQHGPALLIAGLVERCTAETTASIPSQWQRFGPHIGHVPHQVGAVAYGVIFNGDGEGNIDYLAGVEVSEFSGLPAEFARVRVPARDYLVFAHDGPVSDIRRTWNTIYSVALPSAAVKVADAPSFERYGERFDPRTGSGDIEIWIPVEA